MTEDEFIAQLRAAFAVEADEHLQAIIGGLIELEKGPDPQRKIELIETIFREAHSLKGAARAVNRGDIEAVCQALESTFAQWKRGAPAASPETFDALNNAVDVVGKLLTLPGVAQLPADKAAVAEMVKQLEGLCEGNAITQPRRGFTMAEASAATERSHPPSPSSAPTDATVAALAVDSPRLPIVETVRMPVSKMDSLLRQAEEMIAVKLATAQHAAAMRELLDMLGVWNMEWRKLRAARDPAARTGDAVKFTEWNQSFHTQLERKISTLSKVATQDARAAGSLVDELLEDAKKLVMLPFATLLDMFPKLVRDLARDEGKEVELVLRGRDVEIDKRILEEMKDPLIHLVRNSIDHGIEIPAKRTAAGKTARGSLTISVAQRQGGKVEIVVLDDGAGIDALRLRASAVKTGLLSAEEAAQVDDHAALQFIFHSGVSTSPLITEISGRGLGMAIVRDTVKKLGGQLTVGSRAGIGTSFRMLLPVTLAAFKGVLVEAGGQTLVIPTANIERIVRVKREEIRTAEARETITLGGHTVALAWLDAVLELSRKTRSNAGFIEVVVLGAGDERIGFAVDTVLNEQEVLVKNLRPPLLHVRNIAGATVLASGVPVLILHVADLLKSAVRAADSGTTTAMTVTEEEPARRSILVVDDSLVSRMLLKNILESAGYDLATAVDGMDALTQLQTGDFALVVSDVEMPRMDGFHLARRIRADKKLENLPIVLMTALASREHQESGIEAGANAYLLKKNFDHGDLLDVVRKLI